MLAQFLSFIQQQQLFDPSADSLLLAVSGGKDSVALAELLHRSGCRFEIAHCNFQLRGQESERDEQFVRGLAQSYGLGVFVARFDTLAYAQKQRLSVQEAARELRYAYFEQLRQQRGHRYIATAHQLSDSVETVLYQLAKGCGLAGLHGIPARNGSVIRPMLFATAQQVLDFVQAEGLEYVEDSSNSSDKYSRNHIRQQIVPQFKRLFGSFEQIMGENIARWKQAEELHGWAVAEWKARCWQQVENSYRIQKQPLAQAPAGAGLLYQWLAPFGFNPSQTQSIYQTISQQLPTHNAQGQLWVSPNYQLINRREDLLLSPLSQPEQQPAAEPMIISSLSDFPVALNPSQQLTAELLPEMEDAAAWLSSQSQQIAGLGRDCIYIAADKLAFPLSLRAVQSGDKLQPFGLRGRHKLVFDLLKDSGLSPQERLKVQLIESEQGILWLIGHRAAEWSRVEAGCRRLIRLSILEKR